MRRNFPAVLAIAFAAAACTGGKDESKSTQDPFVDSVQPASATVDESIVITGESFGDLEPGTSFVRIGGIDAVIDTWTDESITAIVPSGAYPGSREVTVVNEAGTSNAVAFTVVLPRALYVNDDINNDNSIEGFSVSAAGAAAALPGSPWLQGVDGPAYGGDGDTLAVDVDRRRVFTTANSLLYAWTIDPGTGALSSSGMLTLTGASNAYGIEVTPDGAHVYVADYTTGAVHGATVASNGSLAAIPGSPFDSGLAGVSKLAISMDGAYLYANNELSPNTEIRGFLVGGTGVLAPLSGSPFSNPDESYAFERAPNADRYYISVATYITAYEPDGAGALTEDTTLRENVPGPLFLSFSGDGSRLFATDLATGLHVFDVAATGELVEVANSPFTLTGVAQASTVRASADGTLLFVKSTNAAELHLYSISSAGAPTEVAGSPFPLRATAFGSGAGFSF